MRKFEIGDLIGYNSPDEGYIYGIVVGITETELDAEYIDDSWESFCVPKEEAEYIEPIYLSDEAVKKFARYEITFKELVGEVYPPQKLRVKEKYALTIDDLLCVLQKATRMPSLQFTEEWLMPIREIMRQSFDCGHLNMADSGDSGYRFLPAAGFAVWNAMDIPINCIYDEYNDYSENIEELKSWKSLFDLPFEKRDYPDWCKAHYVKSFDENQMLEKATDKELALFIRFTDELCKKEIKEGLYAKAYGCYGGNRAFPCDWVASRDCLMKLTEIDENPFLSNTLGYIYYYGRCTNGEPEYEKAFKYFSIGAAGGVYESRYKLSDMFRHGYGVPKNEKIAASMIWELYEENLKCILEGGFDSKFADVALRAGDLFKDGINCAADPDDAYYYYLQADFAIKMRMLETDYYGDAKVADGIRKSIEEILPQTSYLKPEKTVNSSSIERIVCYHYPKNRLLEMKAKKLKSGEYSLTFRILPKDGEKYPPKLFITNPAAHFCGMVDNITAKTVNCTKIKIGNRILRDNMATVIFDSAEIDGLYLYGKLVAEIECQHYRLKFPDKSKSERYHFVSVAFQPGGRTYDYKCEIPNVKVGDKLIVETNQGRTEVDVVRVFDKDSTETALPISKYKSILKKA